MVLVATQITGTMFSFSWWDTSWLIVVKLKQFTVSMWWWCRSENLMWKELLQNVHMTYFRFTYLTDLGFCFCNSTKTMREEGGYAHIKEAINKLGLRHKEHIAQYGEGNERRLTGRHETADMNTFSWVQTTNLLCWPLLQFKYSGLAELDPGIVIDNSLIGTLVLLCLHLTLRLDLMHICGRTVLIWCVLTIAMDVGCCQPWCIHPCGSWYREGRKRWTSCLEKQSWMK